MPPTRLLRGAAFAIVLLLSLAGCRSGSAPLVAVRGKVSYRGEALRTGVILFAPDTSRGTRGELAVAEIQPDGSYSLRTGELSGAAPGWHRVTVSAVLPAGPPAPGQRYAIPPAIVPPRYRDPRLSGLACEVKAEQVNQIDFQLD